jgi:hypothetical protein
MGSWEETDLWARLESRDDAVAAAARDTLSRCMPNIVTVLRSADTGSADFTLHDDQHAFRVAQRMVAICPPPTLDALCGYELGLLLLSAYLHDIGMTPNRGLVNAHYSYLFTGDTGGLSEEDLKAFRGWLDEHGRGAVPPLMKTTQSESALPLTLTLVTHYCRNRHVQWSDRWMQTGLSSLRMGDYAAWLDDLRRLCASHHEGLPTLLKDGFAPRLVAAGAIVNLRYLACLLRVADVTELDPERTPDVVFRQRDVAPESAIYWHKDHEIALEASPRSVTIGARPPSAVLHRAIELTANQVDAELGLCHDLAVRRSFSTCPGVADSLPHEWLLPAACVRDIAPRDHAYEYIDGAFRPDAVQILRLLGGEGLYGTPLAALRELVQNAADAVNEQMAWERLSWRDARDGAQVQALRALNKIELSLERSTGGDRRLVCTDTGVGMTKAIITDHLLVSGSSRRRELAELDRLCGEAGFELERTGRFGIGVLSYFMLGDELIVTTERSSESRTADGDRWEFTSNGLDDFGELRRLEPCGRGTTVSLRLRPEVVGDDLAAWEQALANYLDETLVHLPCRLELRTAGGTRVYGPGWCRSDAAYVAPISAVGRNNRNAGEAPSHYSDSQRQAHERELASRRELEAEIAAAMLLHEFEGVLEEGLGVFRSRIAYFELPGGNCFAYMRARQDGDRIEVDQMDNADVFLTPGMTVTSWNGMRLLIADGSLPPTLTGAVVEIDFRGDAAGRLAVSRSALRLSRSARAAQGIVFQEVARQKRALAESWASSEYGSLNAKLAGIRQKGEQGASWLAAEHEKRVWRSVSLPAISEQFQPWVPGSRLRHQGRAVAEVPALRVVANDVYSLSESWDPGTAGPDRLVLLEEEQAGRVPVPLWETWRTGEPLHPLGRTARFPPEWSEVLAFQDRQAMESKFLWNGEHPLVLAVSAGALEWCAANIPDSFDPLTVADGILKDRARAASWLTLMIENRAQQLWGALDERSPGFREQLWRLLFFLRDEPRDQWPVIRVWSREWSLRGTQLSCDSWGLDPEISHREFLPRPAGEEWRLTQDGLFDQDQDSAGSLEPADSR